MAELSDTLPNDAAFIKDGPYKLGLTKREYFAAAAMQGYLSDPDTKISLSEIVVSSVKAADKLIIELNK